MRKSEQTPRHGWRFFSAGGFDQVKLESAADLRALAALDQKLWVALACPTSGLEIDRRTLALIDSDEDGRVRASELIAAVTFACENLKNPDDLFKGSPVLPLAAINDATIEGRTLLSAARQILANVGKPDATALAADDLADRTRLFAGSAFNGDGIITELSAGGDPRTRADIADIAACVGSVLDRAGPMGIDQAKVDAFFTEAQAFVDWHDQARVNAATVLPLGPAATKAAYAAFVAIKHKVDDYFARCRLVEYDARAAHALNRREEEYLDVAARDLTISADEVAGFPLAQVGAQRPLPLAGPVNPAHAAALGALRDAAVVPLLGARTQLAEDDWSAIVAKLAPHATWVAAKAGAALEPLGEARVRELLASDARQTLGALIERDAALAPEVASIENMERLVRYHRDLVLLCTNFVNFKDFYDGGDSVFQCGTLYLDQRACRLCLRVEDAAKHATMAGHAGVCLAYVDCTRKGTEQKMTVVAAFTAGDSDTLMVGRNGIFYDRAGNDWDATITKLVENPIGIRQAFWSPYKKFVRMLEEQVAKRAASHDAESQTMLSDTAKTTANVDRAKAPEHKKIDVGTVAAMGVAFGAIGSFITALIGYGTGIFKLGPMAVVGAMIGIMGLISLPSVILAALKLRKRNLGPILDANGWAVNAKARLNIPFGATLTSVAELPPGAKRDNRDPYADKGFPWKRLLVIALLVFLGYEWFSGRIDQFLPERARAANVLGRAR